MRERKALAILVVHALGDQALERTQVAHHICAALPHQAQPQEEVVVMHEARHHAHRT